MAWRIFVVAASKFSREADPRSNSTGGPKTILARFGVKNAFTIDLSR